MSKADVIEWTYRTGPYQRKAAYELYQDLTWGQSNVGDVSVRSQQRTNCLER